MLRVTISVRVEAGEATVEARCAVPQGSFRGRVTEPFGGDAAAFKSGDRYPAAKQAAIDAMWRDVRQAFLDREEITTEWRRLRIDVRPADEATAAKLMRGLAAVGARIIAHEQGTSIVEDA